jgi:hypothetical protein
MSNNAIKIMMSDENIRIVSHLQKTGWKMNDIMNGDGGEKFLLMTKANKARLIPVSEMEVVTKAAFYKEAKETLEAGKMTEECKKQFAKTIMEEFVEATKN